jgi:hypothetical protein
MLENRITVIIKEEQGQNNYNSQTHSNSKRNGIE